MENLDRLWAIADREALQTHSDFNSAFGEIGLYLQRPLSNWGYNSTPVNSSTFASTGGDGVHYGILHLDGDANRKSPIVMTIPMMPEEANLILGEDLLEFLSLGCQIGYSDLEQLVYDKQDAIKHLTCPLSWSEKIKDWVDSKESTGFDATTRHIGQFIETMRQRRHLLDILTVEFSLKPWGKIEERLGELNSKYLLALRLPASSE